LREEGDGSYTWRKRTEMRRRENTRNKEIEINTNWEVETEGWREIILREWQAWK